MRREPITYVADLPGEEDSNDHEGPRPPRPPQQWAFLSILFVLTILTTLVPVVLLTKPAHRTVEALGSPTTSASPAEPPTDPPTTPSPDPPNGCAAQPCIHWSPHRLRCDSDPCATRVDVRSEGRTALLITGLKFTGAAADRLRADGTCKGAALEQTETCFITIRVGRGEAGRAQLRIQQNLPGPASLVDIDVAASGSNPPPQSDLSFRPQLACSTVPPSEEFDGYLLKIVLTVLYVAPDQGLRQVPVKLESTSGLSGEGSAHGLPGSNPVPVNVVLRRQDYLGEQRFTATVDPDGDISERDEKNNSFEFVAYLQDPPTREEPVKCTTL